MAAQALEIIVTGRLVGGHPIKRRPVTDKDKKPVIGADGQQKTDVSVGIAIPKGAESHWNQTPWGQIIVQAAQLGWPNGEYNSPTFAWKVTDGDSAVPNKNGKKPNEKEGYPGHWVIWGSTQFFIECYHPGKYSPLTDQIKNDGEIKPGDFCRVGIKAKGNNPSISPGVYLNPSVFELSRAGQEIVLTSGMNAAEQFGGSQAVLPQNAQLDASVAAPVGTLPASSPGTPPPVIGGTVVPAAPTAPVTPATPVTQGTPTVIHHMTAKANGATYEQFIAMGTWTDALLIEHGMMINASPGVQPAPSILNSQ